MSVGVVGQRAEGRIIMTSLPRVEYASGAVQNRTHKRGSARYVMISRAVKRPPTGLNAIVGSGFERSLKFEILSMPFPRR